MKRNIIDIQVTVLFELRAYKGQTRQVKAEYRVIGIRNHATGEYHLYITNVPPDMLTAQEVAQTYGYRWEIELLFKELKSYYHLDDVETTNVHATHALLYAAIITWAVARSVRSALLRTLPKAKQRVPARRFAAIFSGVAAGLLELVVHWLGIESSHIERALQTLAAEAVDPNVKRRPIMEPLGS